MEYTDHAKFMLPAGPPRPRGLSGRHRRPNSIVFDIAENRLHAQKAVLAVLQRGGTVVSESKKVVSPTRGTRPSIIIPWLKERGWEVHCLAGDVGQGAEELVGLEEKAGATGASCKVADCASPSSPRPSAGAARPRGLRGPLPAGHQPGPADLARARVEIRQGGGATAVARGCTGKGRPCASRWATAPSTRASRSSRLADLGHPSREEVSTTRGGIPITATKKIYSRDRNLWHISHEGRHRGRRRAAARRRVDLDRGPARGTRRPAA